MASDVAHAHNSLADTKFNSNTGWTNARGIAQWSAGSDRRDWWELMQALSHYSYHISGGDLLLCDLQGGIQPAGTEIILTDPAVSSRAKKFGVTDLGAKGISTFFVNVSSCPLSSIDARSPFPPTRHLLPAPVPPEWPHSFRSTRATSIARRNGQSRLSARRTILSKRAPACSRPPNTCRARQWPGLARHSNPRSGGWQSEVQSDTSARASNLTPVQGAQEYTHQPSAPFRHHPTSYVGILRTLHVPDRYVLKFSSSKRI